nr:MAG TPA: hypothetical protein [Caudoviricetes sp.]
MTRRVFNYGGGMHSPAALTQFLRDAFDGEVANGMEVVAGSGMNVTVKAGTASVGKDPSYDINIAGTETVNIDAASPSNPTNTLIVAYVDRDVAGSIAVTDNTNDVFKLKAVSGAPAAVPSDPTTSAIQAAIGAANPFIILARVLKRTGATSVLSSDITDLRKMIVLHPGRVNSDTIKDGSIEPRHLAPSICDYCIEEVDTGKRWYDGRPIYRKVVRGKINIVQHTNIFFDHKISGLTDNFEIISVSGSIALGGNLKTSPQKSLIPHIEDNQRLGLSLITKTQLRFISSYSWGNSEFSLVLTYIK